MPPDLLAPDIRNAIEDHFVIPTASSSGRANESFELSFPARLSVGGNLPRLDWRRSFNPPDC